MADVVVTAPRLRHLAGLLLLGLLPGCARDDHRVVHVTGVATHGGRPVANLFINFYPDYGRPSWAVSDSRGRFTLQYEKGQPGAVVGTHRVFVTFKPRNPDEE